MIKFIKKRWYIVTALACVIALIAGFAINRVASNSVFASDNSLRTKCEKVFGKNAYACDTDNNVVSVSIKDAVPESTETKIYTVDDIADLNTSILDAELKKVDDTNNTVVFEGYKNGYPTGAIAGYVIDDDNKIIQAYYRDDKITDVEESSIITEGKALELTVDGIKDKYGVDVSADAKNDYRIYYNPQIDKLCYEVKGIEGVVNDIETVFTGIISIDGEHVEIASTLGY